MPPPATGGGVVATTSVTAEPHSGQRLSANLAGASAGSDAGTIVHGESLPWQAGQERAAGTSRPYKAGSTLASTILNPWP
jgi:hypothetical protein